MGELAPFARQGFTSPHEVEQAIQVVATARTGFLNTGKLALHGPRSLIRDSWQRCHPTVSPSRWHVPIAVANDRQLRDLQLANETLLRAARPTLGWLAGFFEGSGYVVGLADSCGHLLEVRGDRASQGHMERIGLTAGGDWSEAAAGTNGIGTALMVGHAIQVVGPEHYCDGWQDITCITTLIRHPWSGEVIGALDLSGDYRLVRPFFSGFLAGSALEIKQSLRHLLASTEAATPPFRIAFSQVGGSPVTPTGFETTCEGRQTPPSVRTVHSPLDLSQQRIRDVERLALAAGCVSTSLDLHLTLKQVAEQTARLLDLDRAAVGLFREQSEQIDQVCAWSRTLPVSDAVAQSLESVLHDERWRELTLTSGEPVVIDDVGGWPHKVGCYDSIASFILLPMISARGVIGLMVAPRTIPYTWAADEVHLGLALAVQAATAVENARNHEILQQQHRHVEALNAVNRSLSTLLDPSQHLPLIIERIAAIMGLDASLIWLEDSSTLEDDPPQTAQHGWPRVGQAAEARAAMRVIAEAIADASGPLLIRRRSTQDARLQQLLNDDGIEELLTAPLSVGGERLGVLVVGSFSDRGLAETNLSLLENIGQQLGLALRNEQLLRSASEIQALRQADQLKSRFLMSVSHDLRSPLTAIRTSVESLLTQPGFRPQDAQGPLLNNIAQQTRRLRKMVDQLLDLSRIQAGTLALDRDWTELPALIADTVAKFEQTSGTYCVVLDVAYDLPLLYIDPDRLVQVLWNVLENAQRYGPPDGPIEVIARRQGAGVTVSIADRGPGIPVEERERVFEYFYRLDRDQRRHRQGSGLGLAICRGIVAAHDGKIWVEPRPGGGSTFLIVLPPNQAQGLAALEGSG